MKTVSHSPKETATIAAEVATRVMANMPYAKRATVLGLVGELGSGKTAFVQAFAQALGVQARPKSPTFTLMHEYRIPDSELSLWHLDCYRLDGRKDLEQLDLATVLPPAVRIKRVVGCRTTVDTLICTHYLAPDKACPSCMKFTGGDNHAVNIIFQQ